MANDNNTTIFKIGKVQLPASAVSTVISGLVDVFLLASSTPDLDDYCDIHDKNGKQSCGVAPRLPMCRVQSSCSATKRILVGWKN